MEKNVWKSKLGFILASSGAAVGLGNIQRFPALTAQNGGAAFVFLYLICVILIGFPLILVEFALGRKMRATPMKTFELLGKNKKWAFLGALGVATAFFILSYYIVAAGWTVAYAWMSLASNYEPIKEFISYPWQVFSYTFFIHLIATLVVQKGLNQGIERFSKIVMPCLFLLLLGLVAYSLSLDGADAGLRYYLYPDFSKITSQSFIAALSQAFFSLCIGEAVLMVYGSYAQKDDNLPLSAFYIALCDTLVAVLAGLMIFPALFSFGASPEAQGSQLLYQVMPRIFEAMPMGYVFGFCFFLMLTFAALTTCVALLEASASSVSEFFGWNKKRTVWILSSAALILSIPAILAQAGHPFLSQLTVGHLPATGYYDLMDYIWGGLSMVLTGFLSTLFCGFIWGDHNARAELEMGSPGFKSWSFIWGFYIKWLAPIGILVVLSSLLFF